MDKPKAGPDRTPGSDPTVDPDPQGTPNRMAGGGVSPARNAPEGKPGMDQGAQPGAHGDRPPHQNVKPGTRLDLEEQDTDA